MIESALLGGVLGGVARMVPEVLKFFDRKAERKHELDMNEFQFKFQKEAGAQKLELTQLEVDSAQVTAGISAIQSAYQSMKTGFKFADTISALVRPYVTAVIFNMYVAVKVAAYYQLAKHGLPWEQAVQTIWGPDDVALLFGITNFWFLGRVFEKRA